MKPLLAFLNIGIALCIETPKIEDCDKAYQLRPEKISETADCYFAVSESLKDKTSEEDLVQRQYALEMTALSSSWNAMRSEEKDIRNQAISLGMKSSQTLIETFPKTATGFYWNAIFLSAYVKDQDEGAIIPTHTLKALPKIKSKLRKTIELDETIHGYGAHRVLGIIYTTVPGLVGGDKELGEKYFKTALEKAPRFSANPLYFGKFLVKEERVNEAKDVLKDLIETDANTFDQDRIPETELDQEEAKETLK